MARCYPNIPETRLFLIFIVITVLQITQNSRLPCHVPVFPVYKQRNHYNRSLQRADRMKLDCGECSRRAVAKPVHRVSAVLFDTLLLTLTQRSC